MKHHVVRQALAVERAPAEQPGSERAFILGSRLRSLPEVTPLPGSEFVIEADMVVKALGQQPLFDLLAGIKGLNVKNGRVVVDSETMQTSVPKLYSGGDCTSKGAEIVDAVAEGKKAAQAINRRLHPKR